jgi:hypothetical protein
METILFIAIKLAVMYATKDTSGGDDGVIGVGIDLLC